MGERDGGREGEEEGERGGGRERLDMSVVDARFEIYLHAAGVSRSLPR